MSRFNTGNPLGSGSPLDLDDNAKNLDEAANSPADTFQDRLGKSRLTWSGMENQFESDQGEREVQFDADQSSREQRFRTFIASSGYQFAGEYAAGTEITQYNQIIRDGNGEFWRVSGQVDLPYVTTGSGIPEGDALVPAGDAVLRQDLANPDKGARLLGFKQPLTGSLERTVQEVLESAVSVTDFASGDGVTDDTTAFSSFESAIKGREVDLQGRTYLVSSIPQRNAYINGRFKVGAASFPAELFGRYLSGVPKFSAIGGQLQKLKIALGDPLVQFVGIVAVGDSITWGRTLPDNSTHVPNTQLLTSARDNASSPSFWNNLRRYIGEQYMSGATLALSNWADAPSGEAIATYTKALTIYPKDGPFTLSVTGDTQTAISAVRAFSPTGFMYTLADGAPGGANYQDISFNFTGDRFTLILRATNTGDFNNYDLIVDGVNIGTFTTQDGVDGIVSGDNNRRLHTFGYIRDKVVTIRTNSTGLTGNRRLYLEGIEVPKTVRLTNQGIIGQTSRTYDLYNLSGPFSNPTAVTAQDNFIFCQFGTNDRGDTDVPPGAAEFQKNMQAIVNRLTPLGDVVLMCAGPLDPATDPPSAIGLNMQDVRGVISKVAKANNLDFIDNLAPFEAISPSIVLDGPTHPNALGHAIMARNIINALESAS